MNAPWHIAVLVPARNEQDLLPRCIRSVQRARSYLPQEVTSDLIVVSDSSSDETFRLAQKMIRGDGVVVEVEAGCVGTARAIAARLALARFVGPEHRCWLANTDADCEVPTTWLLDHIALAETGATAVAGIIDVDSFADHAPQVPDRFRMSYLIHADGTHPHVHGANFGVRADAYLQAGGWQELATAEDHDLWQRLHHGRHRRVADARLRVVTSGRRIGRAPLGFAGALAAHNGTSA